MSLTAKWLMEPIPNAVTFKQKGLWLGNAVNSAPPSKETVHTIWSSFRSLWYGDLLWWHVPKHSHLLVDEDGRPLLYYAINSYIHLMFFENMFYKTLVCFPEIYMKFLSNFVHSWILQRSIPSGFKVIQSFGNFLIFSLQDHISLQFLVL